MNELLLPGLLIAVIAAIAVAAGGVRASITGAKAARLVATGRKLDALLKHHGIRFDPYGEVPQPVLDALRRGKKIEAIKEYRAATGAGLKEAKDYVEDVQRSGSAKI